MRSYFLELPASFDEYLASRSAKFRNHLRRTQRKTDAVSARIDEIREPADVERGYELLLEVDRASWKHTHGTAITAVRRQLAFYRELCHGAAAAGRLRLQVLIMNDQPVAYNLGYVRDDCYSYLKTSYVEECKAMGVSTYLRAHLIQRLIEDGVRTMDFQAEPYEWEKQWTDTVRWHSVLWLYRKTPRRPGARACRQGAQRNQCGAHRATRRPEGCARLR
jgi:CelD/BcsL family acetyltransferase involved in cellulose biosynthesis